MKLCPGFEVFKVKGYADLEGLRTDLQNYFEFVRAGRGASEGAATATTTVAPGSAPDDAGTDTDIATDTGTGATTATAATMATVTVTSASFATPSPISESGTNATDSSDVSWDEDAFDVNGTDSTAVPDAEDPFPPTTSGINATIDNATDAFSNDDANNSTLPESEILCPADVFQCDDATSVSRDPFDDCRFFPCADGTLVPEVGTTANTTVAATPFADRVPALACNTDVFQCDDFSLVNRDPSNDCRFESCDDGTVIPEEDHAAGRLEEDAVAGGDGSNATDVADYDGNATDSSNVLPSAVAPGAEEGGFDYGGGEDYNGTAVLAEGDDYSNGTAFVAEGGD